MAKKRKPNFLVVLIDDLRFDELGICGHPYMKTPHIDRIGHEGAMFTQACRRLQATCRQTQAGWAQ